MIKKSELWEEITDQFFSNHSSSDMLVDFRQPNSINSRLASWSPTDHSSRHFKFLLWNALENMGKGIDDFFDYLKKINSRAIGNPTTIHYNNLDVDIDYLLSCDELIFLEKENAILSNCRSIIEIGAGFGRTAHAILENFDHIEQYTIIDLPEVLTLSKAYLSCVIPDKISKIQFINAFDNKQIDPADLFINIDSFQEMTPETISEYHNKVIKKCHFVYIKNPVGKYRPEEFDIHTTVKNDKPLSLGLCRDVYTICNDVEHKQSLSKYLKNYSFEHLELKNHRRCVLFHYYHHVVYLNRFGSEA